MSTHPALLAGNRRPQAGCQTERFLRSVEGGDISACKLLPRIVGHGITKCMLHHGWAMDIDQAIEAEAQAQALCTLTGTSAVPTAPLPPKSKPVFEGN